MTALVIGFVLFFSYAALAQEPSKEPPISKSTEGNSMPTRVKRVASFFSPAPGNLAELDQADLRDRGSKSPMTLRGFISIKPPKSSCLTIRKSVEIPDVRVCQNTPLSFNASEIRTDGSILWQVLLENENEPIDLSWPTLLRIGKRVPARKQLPSIFETFLVTKCQADSDGRGAFIRLSLASGEVWTLIPPKEDVLAEQDPDMPDVYIQGMESQTGGIQVDRNKISRKSNNAQVRSNSIKPAPIPSPTPVAPETSKDAKVGEPGHNAETKEATADDGQKTKDKDGHGKNEKPKKKKKDKGPVAKRFQVFETGERWTIPRRNSFEMPAGRLKTLNDEGPSNGICRYQFVGAGEDPEAGWIECKDAGLYDVIFVHLSCAKQFLEVRRDTKRASAAPITKSVP